MTDSRPLANLSGSEQLWNVTLLPLAPRREAPETKSLEILDERRSAGETVTLLASFESQLKAVGW